MPRGRQVRGCAAPAPSSLRFGMNGGGPGRRRRSARGTADLGAAAASPRAAPAASDGGRGRLARSSAAPLSSSPSPAPALPSILAEVAQRCPQLPAGPQPSHHHLLDGFNARCGAAVPRHPRGAGQGRGRRAWHAATSPVRPPGAQGWAISALLRCVLKTAPSRPLCKAGLGTRDGCPNERDWGQ